MTGYKNVDRLKLKLREHGAVFMKSSEAIDLPKQVFNYIWCDNTKEYLKFDRDKIIEIDGKRYSADFKLSERVIKRYLCSRAKLGALKDIINSTDDRLIIFYNFNEELAKIKEAIKDRPISVVNGDIKDLEAYEKHSNSITLIQYIAGSFGLNLQLANKIIYFSLPDGGAEMFDQSIKRIHRIGQDRTCFYYILAVKNSIETEIINNLKLKSQRINNLFEKSL